MLLVVLAVPAVGSAADYRAEVLADAPTSYWRLGEPTGLIGADSSGNGFDTAYYNGVSLGVPGALPGDSDTAVWLDGIDDRISRPVVTTQTANITVEAWISWEGVAGTPLIVYNGNSGTNGFGLMISDGRCAPGELLIVLNGGVACNAAGSAGLVPRGVWQHVAATRSAGGVWTIYVNGEQRATGLTTAPNPAISGGTSVGAAFEDNDYNHFRGRIDEVAVYDRALSAERIRAHYEATGRSAGGVPFPQTFGTGLGGHTRPVTGFQSDPVSSATGAYVTSQTDASLPSVGVPFTFTRTYTSANPSTGALGPRWTHSYSAQLSISGDYVTFHAEDGRQVMYSRTPDGSFVGERGALSTLVSTPTGYDVVTVDQRRYGFDTQGRLTAVRDRNSRGVALTYDVAGVLQTITDSAGRAATLSYHPSGLLASLTLADGRQTSYGYTDGRLTSVVDMRGGTTGYRYDTAGRLDRVVDQNGNAVVTNVYGSDGRVIAQTDARGKVSTFAWDAAAQTSTMTDARGKAWKDVYANNVLQSRVDPLGGTVRYEYDASLNRTKVIDPRGNATTMTYDSRGNLLTRTAPAPLSYAEVFTYDGQNNPLTVRDGRGNTTSHEYDAVGNLIKITRPGAVVTLLERDPAGTGLLKKLTDPRLKQTLFDHDGHGNLTRVTTHLGSVTTMGYDASGRMTSRVEPRGNVQGANPAEYTTTYTYDNADHRLTATDPLGNTTSWAYDPAGNLANLTDAKNRTTIYGHDPANHLTSVTAPDTTSTSYEYDDAGNRIARTDANTHTTTYEYDDANRLISATSPLLQKWTYSYDVAGNLQTAVNAAGNATPTVGDGQTTLTYDQLNRLTGVDYSDATSDVVFGYDANGNRTQMTDGSGTETYSYDALNRLTAVTRGANAFSYEYDAADNVTRRTYPDTAAVTYTYDDDGRLSTVASGTEVTSYGYDAAGNLTRETLPAANGHVETRAYDRAGRLAEVQHAKEATVLNVATYTLDPVGNPTQIVRTSGTETYAYDALDRLAEVCFQASCPLASDPFIRWTYDSVGNRKTEARAAGTTAYTYDAGDQLTGRSGLGGSVAYAYDPNGNQTQAGTRTFAYDLANRMTSTTSGSSTISYLYDGDGKRLQETAGRSVTKLLWDPNYGLPQLALERTSSDALLRRYVYGSDLVSMTTSAGAFYVHEDGLGSVQNLTNASGARQWTYVYEPFGLKRTETKNSNKAPVNPMQFTGEYLDAAPSLYHLRARQYDPLVGRFSALDPIATPLTVPYVAAYAYVGNRPTTLVDPSGLKGNRWVDLALAGYAGFDAFVAYGTAVAIGSVCLTSDLITGPVAVAAATPACVAGVGGAGAAGYLESRAAGEKFYDFLHPDDAELNSSPVVPIRK